MGIGYPLLVNQAIEFIRPGRMRLGMADRIGRLVITDWDQSKTGQRQQDRHVNSIGSRGMARVEQQHDHLTYVRSRLEEWGAWQRELSSTRLGYPRQASHLAMHTGGYTEPVFDNSSAEEIDQLLATLKLMIHDWYAAIEQSYAWNASDVIAAGHLHVSVSTLKKRRGQGEAWLAGRLAEV